ncbi:hypothetical protein GCM10010392_38910 [Streptomyces clavifer]|nr:hypothetical protein GCM10010392_38910 [Streptomyces clavifer]
MATALEVLDLPVPEGPSMATITAAGAVRAAALTVSTVVDTFLVHGVGGAGHGTASPKVTECARGPRTPVGPVPPGASVRIGPDEGAGSGAVRRGAREGGRTVPGGTAARCGAGPARSGTYGRIDQPRSPSAALSTGAALGSTISWTSPAC